MPSVMTQEVREVPFRSARTLQQWIDEFRALRYPSPGDVRVIAQDGDEGADTGLISIHLGDAGTSIYIQPEPPTRDRWMITLEPRDESITLDAAGLARLAAELSSVSSLCAFLQAKSGHAVEEQPG